MSSASTVPAAQAELTRLLAAHFAGTGVYVRRGLPTEVPADRERLYISGHRSFVRTVAHPGVVRESYELRVIAEAHLSEPVDVVETRTWALLDGLSAVLTEEPELGGTVWEAAALTAVEDDQGTGPAPDGWVARLVGFVSVSVVLDEA